MKAKFFLSWLSVYAVNSITGYLIHHVILGNTYKVLAASLHAHVINRLWAFILISLTGSFFFTFIYSNWKKNSTVSEGLKYGFFIGVWMGLNVSLTAYAGSELIPFSLAVKWITFTILQYILSGLVLALMYNNILQTKNNNYANQSTR